MAAIPKAAPQDDLEPSSARPFTAPDAGADYFATDGHCRALAGRIITRLRQGPGFVLVTGNPPPDPHHLAPALTNVAAGSYTVSVVTCGPELNREHLLRTAPSSGAPLFVFDGADSLSDAQLDGLCEALASGDGVKPAAVLLARPGCVTRLERLQPRLSKEGLASHFRLNELAHEEVETFIRRQLPADEQPTAFTAEAISAIADFSGGDPAAVNRLSRVIADFTQSAGGREAKKPQDGASEVEEAAQTSLETLALERRPPRRRHSGIAFLVGILLCLAIGGLAPMAADHVSFLSGWLRPLYDFASDELAGKELTSERGPAPLSAPPAAAFVGLPVEPKSAPPAAETTDAQPITPPAAAHVAASAEPNLAAPAAEPTQTQPITPPAAASAAPKPPAPTAETIEAQPVTPSPAAPLAAPAEPRPPAATSPAVELPPPPRTSAAAETGALVARGDALVIARDIVSARLYYERAAELGDGHGALRMGETFDPVFLERAAIRGTRADEQEALSWYRRARDLGDAEADRLLKSLEPH